MKTHSNRSFFYMPITKAEKMEDGSLHCHGTAAVCEPPDKVRDILDWDNVKDLFTGWIGNIREQHDPLKAVGHAIDYQFDDASKSVGLDFFISAGSQDTQLKVLDGTLGGLSLHGAPYTRTPVMWESPDGKKIPCNLLKMDHMVEVAVVDSSMQPGCNGLTIWKADGEFEDDVPLSDLGADGLPVDAEKADKGDSAKPYGDVEYADPGYQEDGKKRYPIDTEAHIQSAWSYIGQAKNAAKYTAEELKKIKAKVVSAWKKKIDPKGPPSAAEKGYVMEMQTDEAAAGVKKWDGCEICDVQSAQNAIDDLTLGIQQVRGLINVESNEDQAEPPEQLVALRAALDSMTTAVSALGTFISSEILEVDTDEADESADGAKADKAKKKGKKVAAFFQSGDPKSAQKVHNLSVKHGAKCMKDDAAMSDKEKGSKKADDAPPPEDPPVSTEETPVPASEPAAEVPPEVPAPAAEAPVPEAPAPEATTPEPSAAKADAGWEYKALLARVESLSQSLTKVQGDLSSATKAHAEERTTLTSQVEELKGIVAAYGERIVEPGAGIGIVKGVGSVTAREASGPADMTAVGESLLKAGGPEVVKAVAQELIKNIHQSQPQRR